VRFVSSGPFGPPMPGGGSLTSRLKSAQQPASVGPAPDRYLKSSAGNVPVQCQVVFNARAIASSKRQIELPGVYQIEDALRILQMTGATFRGLVGVGPRLNNVPFEGWDFWRSVKRTSPALCPAQRGDKIRRVARSKSETSWPICLDCHCTIAPSLYRIAGVEPQRSTILQTV